MAEAQSAMQDLVTQAQQALGEARAFRTQIDTAPAGTLTEARRTELNTSYTVAFNRAKDLKARADSMKGESDLETNLNALSNNPVQLHPQGGTGRPSTVDALTLESPNLNAALSAYFGFSDGVVNSRAGMLDFIRQTEFNHLDRAALAAIPELKPEARAAYNRYLQRPRSSSIGDVETRTLSPYVDPDGGYIISREMRSELMRQERDLIQIRRYARVIRTNAASVAIPTFKLELSLDQTRALKTASIANIRDILGMESFVPAEYSKIIKVPQQLVEDSTFPLTSLLAEEIALQSAEDEEALYLIGTGKNQPYGVLTAPIKTKDIAGSGAAISPNDLKALPYQLRPPFRRRAAWLTNKEQLAVISVMRTDSGAAPGTGQYIWQLGLQPGDPDRIAGYPVLESAFFPTAAADGDPLVLFGDWSQYWIIDRLALSIQRLDELYAETSEIGFKYRKRFTGGPVRLEAFIRLNRN